MYKAAGTKEEIPLFPGRRGTAMQFICRFAALDLLTSVRCCLMATLRPQDVTPAALFAPTHPPPPCRLEKGGEMGAGGKGEQTENL